MTTMWCPRQVIICSRKTGGTGEVGKKPSCARRPSASACQGLGIQRAHCKSTRIKQGASRSLDRGAVLLMQHLAQLGLSDMTTTTGLEKAGRAHLLRQSFCQLLFKILLSIKMRLVGVHAWLRLPRLRCLKLCQLARTNVLAGTWTWTLNTAALQLGLQCSHLLVLLGQEVLARTEDSRHGRLGCHSRSQPSLLLAELRVFASRRFLARTQREQDLMVGLQTTLQANPAFAWLSSLSFWAKTSWPGGYGHGRLECYAPS